MDVAQIGFSADTADLKDAKASLEQLVPASGRAERAAQRLAKMTEAGARAASLAARAELQKANAVAAAARATGTATREEIAAATAGQRKARATYEAARASEASVRASNAAAKAARLEAQALDEAARAARNRRNPANDNPAGGGAMRRDPMLMAQSSPSNIAAQFQDIGVTAAMGMNPIMIALQQGTQLSMAFAGGLRGIGQALLMMLSPLSIATIAVVGIVAALLQAVNWTNVAQGALNGLATAVENFGQYAIYAAGALALIYSPAIVTGIVSLVALISRVGVAATIAGAQMAAAWLVAAGPIAWLVTGVGAVIAALVIFRDEITNIVGHDVVGTIQLGVNSIVGAFIGAFNGIKAAWGELPFALADIVISVANLVVSKIEDMVNGVIDIINDLIEGANNALGNFGVNIDPLGEASFGGFNNPYEGAGERVAETFKEEFQAAMGEDYIGQIGGAVENLVSGAADKIRELAAGLGTPGEDESGSGSGGGGKSETDKFAEIVAGAERSIAALEAERAAIGLSEEAAARLRHETELLNQARQAGIDLTPAQRETLMALAGDMATLETEIKRTSEALDFAKGVVKGFASDFRSALDQGKSIFEAFGTAVTNAIDKIVDKLLNDLIDALFEVNTVGAGMGGGGGNWLGNIFSWVGGLFGFAKGGAFPQGISDHSNSVVSQPTLFAFASGTGLMGEAGPEAIMPLKRGPDGSLGVQMYRGSGSGGGAGAVDVNVHATIGWSRNADGNLRPFVEDVATETMQAGIQAYDEALPARKRQLDDNPWQEY